MTGKTGIFGTEDKVESFCLDCKMVINGVSLVEDRVCPECGGSLVGIRFCRNPLTRKVLFADRIDL